MATTKKQTKQAPAPVIEPKIELTPEEQAFVKEWEAVEAAERKQAHIKRYLAARIDSAKATIESFKKDLDANPAHALEWASNTFTAAAMIQVAGYALKCLEQGATLQDTLADILRHALRTVSNSTSQTANLMEREKQQVAARLYDEFSRY